MAQWEQVGTPDGYDSPAFGSGEYVVAPKRDDIGAVWHILKKDDSGQLELLGAPLMQTRHRSSPTEEDVRTALGWAETQIAKD